MTSRILPAIVAVLGLAVGLVTAHMYAGGGPVDPTPKLKDATALFGKERPLPAFSLQDHTGAPFDRARLDGQWTLVFFGYTYCPDVCPMTLSNLKVVMDSLPEGTPAQRLNVSFVSVDPKRDTRERLAAYVPFFNKDFIGVTGDKAQIDTLVSALGAVYQLGEPDAETGAYMVDHSSRLLLIDPQGRFNAILSDRASPEVLTEDLKTLFEAYAG